MVYVTQFSEITQIFTMNWERLIQAQRAIPDMAPAPRKRAV
jgi:hypothetical protein